MKHLFYFSILTAILTGCISVSPNVHTVVTNDCWNNIRLVKPGDFKPKLTMACDKMVVLPSYQMPGSVEIKARFSGDAKSKMTVDYLYQITDPLVFIGEAKFILQSGFTDEDDYSKPNEKLELAENTVIDKLIKDAVRDSLSKISILDFDETQFENTLQKTLNLISSKRGVTLSAISIRVDYGEQTEEAIDAISAQSLYKESDLKEVGGEIMKAKAGKPTINITVENKPEEKE